MRLISYRDVIIIMSSELEKNIGNSVKMTRLLNDYVSPVGIIQALQPLMTLPVMEQKQITESSMAMASAMSNAVGNHGMDYSSVLGIGSVLQTELAIISKQFAEKVALMNLSAKKMSETLGSFSYQSEIIQQLVSMPQTSLIKDLKGYISSVNIDGCVSALSQAFGNSIIHACDLALAKNTTFGKELLTLSVVPDDVVIALSHLNLLTSRALEYEEDIFFDVPCQEYVDETAEGKARLNSSEMNSVGYAYTLLNANILAKGTEFITAIELMNFMTVLSEMRTFASENPVGKKIFNMINLMWNQNEYIGLDCDYYYHARTIEDDSAPYVLQEMLKAPHGVTGPGRFNYPGEAYYYTADTAEGAKREVLLHSKRKNVQIVKLKPKGHPKLLDLSIPMRWGREFLKYIRFNVEEDLYSYMPREYLIPNYVSDCCRRVGFDGIKYYGGKDYNNYVTWRDGYYDGVDML